jgi:hypothetical protein
MAFSSFANPKSRMFANFPLPEFLVIDDVTLLWVVLRSLAHAHFDFPPLDIERFGVR